jgi:hypothetical protein
VGKEEDLDTLTTNKHVAELMQDKMGSQRRKLKPTDETFVYDSSDDENFFDALESF